MNVPDNYDMWAKHDSDRETELDMLPECVECGYPIQADHYFFINDEIICIDCMKENYMKRTEDYVR